MQDSKFYVYSKTGCGFCNKLTEFMKNKGVKFEKFDLGTDSSEEFLLKFGKQSTFPQVVLNDNQRIGGMKDTVRFLMENKFV